MTGYSRRRWARGISWKHDSGSANIDPPDWLPAVLLVGFIGKTPNVHQTPDPLLDALFLLSGFSPGSWEFVPKGAVVVTGRLTVADSGTAPAPLRGRQIPDLDHRHTIPPLPSLSEEVNFQCRMIVTGSPRRLTDLGSCLLDPYPAISHALREPPRCDFCPTQSRCPRTRVCSTPRLRARFPISCLEMGTSPTGCSINFPLFSARPTRSTENP